MEGIHTLNSERISHTSEKYREMRERIRETVSDGAMIFGEEVIIDIDRNRQILRDLGNYILAEHNEEEKEKLLDHKLFFETCCSRRLSQFKEEFDQLPTNEAIPFFETVSTFPHIKELLQNELPWLKKISKYNEITLLLCSQKNDISDNLFEEMLRSYVNFWEGKQEEFHEKAPYLLATFKEKALEAIKENKLPINQEYLEERIGETRIYLGDNMSLGECVNGDYDLEDGVVRIAYRDNKNAQEKTVFHEMIHALSGRTVRLKGGNLDHQRFGLGFSTYDKQGNKNGKQFRWLNEAVTEEITIELSGLDHTYASYSVERKYLHDLYSQGVSKKLIYDAYFENYDPDSKEKVPKWKELISQIKDTHPTIEDRVGSVEYLKKVEQEIQALKPMSQ